MMNYFLPCLLFIIGAFRAGATQIIGENQNVVISRSALDIHFVAGDATNPVQIKKDLRKIYTCKNFRTEVPVVEFYNDMERIDHVSILVDQSRKHAVRPKHDYYNMDGIFYSDARVCYFDLPLVKQGSSSEVVFKKTILDPHYFTTVYFMDEYFIAEQEIKLSVPSWMKIEIKEFNFGQFNIRKTIQTTGNVTTYTYAMNDLPAYAKEKAAPGASYFMPHIMVRCQTAQSGGEEYVYFNSLKDQYAWYRKLVNEMSNDDQLIAQTTREILGDQAATDEEKVKILYQWVQDHIRYIAFEDGIAGFKPENAQEVLRKKYGDCKGMANLLTVMLRSIGLDARRCWIGTRHIAYDYSTPSLAVDNHMIAVWMNKGKPVYLDATEKYIGFGEIAERIQNRQTLIENGAQYLLEKVPTAGPEQNTNAETRIFKIEGHHLRGHVKQIWKGENKVWLLNALHSVKQEKQENVLKQYLSQGNKNYEISGVKIKNIDNYQADLEVEYEVFWKNAVSVFGNEIYFSLEDRRPLENFRIDTAKRKLPYWFDFKNNFILETQIELPAETQIRILPDPLSVLQEGYGYKASYNVADDKIIYRREIIIHQAEIKKEDFSRWNADNMKLTNFYNQQIVLAN